MLRSTLFTLVIGASACGGGSSTADAPGGGDAAVATVVAVTCPGTPAATISTTDTTSVYSPPSTTITRGQIIQFTMSPAHNAVPDPTMSDPGINVGFGATKCLMFTQTGTFRFHCSLHSFKGTVVVQ